MDQSAALSIIGQFKKELELLGIQPEQLILFGSHSAGTAREDSDIDLVVISSGFSNRSYWERIDILTEAIYRVSAPIEASAFTPEEWKAGKSLLVDYARNGVWV